MRMEIPEKSKPKNCEVLGIRAPQTFSVHGSTFSTLVAYSLELHGLPYGTFVFPMLVDGPEGKASHN